MSHTAEQTYTQLIGKMVVKNNHKITHYRNF